MISRSLVSKDNLIFQNSKTLVELSARILEEMKETGDAITGDLRNVADMHMSEISEAWEGMTKANSLTDLMLFSGNNSNK